MWPHLERVGCVACASAGTVFPRVVCFGRVYSLGYPGTKPAHVGHTLINTQSYRGKYPDTRVNIRVNLEGTYTKYAFTQYTLDTFQIDRKPKIQNRIHYSIVMAWQRNTRDV